MGKHLDAWVKKFRQWNTDDSPAPKVGRPKRHDPVGERVKLWFFSMFAFLAGTILMVFEPLAGAPFALVGIVGFLWVFLGPDDPKPKD